MQSDNNHRSGSHYYLCINQLLCLSYNHANRNNPTEIPIKYFLKLNWLLEKFTYIRDRKQWLKLYSSSKPWHRIFFDCTITGIFVDNVQHISKGLSKKYVNLKSSFLPLQQREKGLRGQLQTPKCGTQYPVTKVTSDEVTVLTSYWNISGLLRMSKNITSHMTSKVNGLQVNVLTQAYR